MLRPALGQRIVKRILSLVHTVLDRLKSTPSQSHFHEKISASRENRVASNGESALRA